MSTPQHDLQLVDFNVDELRPYHKNPRRGDVEAIARSLEVNGQYRPIVVNLGSKTGRPLEVLAGNHTLKGAVHLGWTSVKGSTVDVDDVAAARIVAADNRLADRGDYDEEALLDLLQNEIGAEELDGSGYDEADIDVILDRILNGDGDVSLRDALGDTDRDDLGDEGRDRAETTGETLAIVDVTMADPQAEVHHGEVWRLGRHTLVVATLLDEWPLWAPLLAEGVQFCPYPEPYLTCSTLARERPLLLVQPNTYLAGHLIDKHRSAFPKDVVDRIEEAR